MKKFFQLAVVMIALGAFGISADAQGKGKGKMWDGNKQARKEYRKDVKHARKEYRRDVKEARRDYRSERKLNHQRGRGYYAVRPHRGARRGHVKGRLPVGTYRVRPVRRGYIVRRNR